MGREALVGVTAAATQLGVSVRTLHHWDAVGLLQPSARGASGARRYAPADLARGRRVLLHRELGLPLDRIGALLDAPRDERRATLEHRRAQIEAEQARLDRAAHALSRLLEADAVGPLLPIETQRAIFGTGWRPEDTLDARERWGDSPQWAEYAERSARRTEADWLAIASDAAALDRDLAAACVADVDVASRTAHALADRHRASLDAYFHCTVAMQVVIVRSSPPEALEHYDALAPGLASWLRGAVESRAAALGVDPETATWG